MPRRKIQLHKIAQRHVYHQLINCCRKLNQSEVMSLNSLFVRFLKAPEGENVSSLWHNIIRMLCASRVSVKLLLLSKMSTTYSLYIYTYIYIYITLYHINSVLPNMFLLIFLKDISTYFLKLHPVCALEQDYLVRESANDAVSSTRPASLVLAKVRVKFRDEMPVVSCRGGTS